MSDTPPNIILINCDDLGYGDLGCYGSPVNETPALDSLAEEGLLFTDFYMASPVCSPSRGAMMTGCYPPRIGFGKFEHAPVLFPGQPYGLNPQELTLPKLLKHAGYVTKMVGKWHCGDQKAFLPTEHGFDSYYGLPYSNDMGRQFEDDKYPPLPLLRDKEVIQEQPDQGSLTERYVEESIRFIRENVEQPFFLYFAHLYVHLPLYVPKQFLAGSKNGAYGAAVASIDWAADALLHELRRLGLEENTLIIFTSDNGSRCQGEGGSNGMLRGTKGTTWEGGQRIPCIMRWPKRISAGTRSREMATAMDFLPTFADIIGKNLDDVNTLDGKSILPLMESGGEAPSPHEVFFYYRMNDLEAVRDKTWKLHFLKQGEPIQALYNLADDPSEERNLYKERPDIVATLEQHAAKCREDLGDEASGITGKNIRPKGCVEIPDTLTHWNPEHPYIIALYDLKDRG